MKPNYLLEAVTDSLQALGIPEETVQKVPTLVRRAVVDLQRDDILPPRVMSFKAIDKKKEYRDASGELYYNYIELPKGYRKLHELYVNDQDIPYKYVSHENYLESISKAKKVRKNDIESFPDRLRLFSTTHINMGDNDIGKPIIPIYPYPDDDVTLQLKYYIDGTENSLNLLDDTYHTLIVNKVQEFLNLRAPQDVTQLASEMASEWKNRKGKNSINATMLKTKPHRMFGK